MPDEEDSEAAGSGGREDSEREGVRGEEDKEDGEEGDYCGGVDVVEYRARVSVHVACYGLGEFFCCCDWNC